QARYGRVHADAPVELIMLRVSAVIAMPKPELQGLIGQGGAIAPEARTREVYFPSAGRRLQVPVYDRADLPSGFELSGPAIVEEYSSTTVVGVGDRLVVGQFGELRIDCSESGSSHEDRG